MSAELDQIAREVSVCTACALHRSRLNAVPGEGPDNAAIMFIGEAPGWHENQQGRPFVGPAGQFLEELLASIGMRREQVFIANVVKCRPPENRDPLPDEIKTCEPYLDRQIALIKPKLIVTLGRYSMAKFFPKESISKIHGLARRQGDFVVLALYHPAAALHQPRYKADIEADFQKIPQLLAEAAKVEEASVEETPEQLSLF